MKTRDAEGMQVSTERTGSVATVLLLLAIAILALGLRLYRLDNQSLWYDEGFSVYLAGMDLDEITSRTAADIQPPLYYYLLHGWILLFGDSEWALRALSVLFGVVAVPVLYGVAWLLFRSRAAGLLAALLIAVSPLHLWYGQEARMYTLLTWLCLLSSLLLLLAMAARRAWVTALLWAAYTAATVAALYTHYFALFVLAGQAVYVLVVLTAQGFRPLRLLVGSLASGVAILLSYLPWLPYLYTRYGTDVSYWPGKLKIHEVLVDIGIVFSGGESVTESMGIIFAGAYGLAFLGCLVALYSRASSAARERAGDSDDLLPVSYFPLLFLLLYFFLPLILILIVSYNSPKFNARYAIVSHPALLLVLAGGLVALWQRRNSYLGNLLRGTLAALVLIMLLGTAAYANYNVYTDPTFARADFRSVAAYVRQNIEPGETVILTSGHMFPVWDYYAPGLERHLLPDSPTLDTSVTLDYSIARVLNPWLEDRDGVWLVLWQDEVVDPTGYLTAMLADAGEEQPVEQAFPQIELRHYRLPEGAFVSEEPEISHPVQINFGDRLQLLGYTQTGDQEVALFWQALQPLEDDYRVSIVLRDTAGQIWGQWDGRPAAYLYPTDRWRVGQIVFGRYKLVPMAGTPPGDYGLEIGVYTEDDLEGLDVLDLAGAPQGKRAMLGAVRLSVPAVPPGEIEVPNPSRIEMGDGLTLLGWRLDRTEAQPGDRILLTLVWSVESPPSGDYRVRISAIDESGQTLDAGTFPLTSLWHPTTIWLPGQAWRGQNSFRLPIQMQPGLTRLAVQLVNVDGTALGSATELTAITVLPTERVFTPPQPQSPRQANFEDEINLLGADLAPDPVPPGDILQVTLYWQALAEMDIGYTAFVHLLDANGEMVAGHDSEPVAGTRPTNGWVPGEFVTDRHDITIPADLPQGQYVIEVGLYDAGAARLPRLSVLGSDGQAATDTVIFGPVQVH